MTYIRMNVCFIVSLSILLRIIQISAHSKDHILMGKILDYSKKSFVKLTRTEAHADHSIVIAVKQNNREYLDKLLIDISTPGSPKYGKYLSREEVHNITSNPIAVSSIYKFLASNNISVTHITPYEEYISCQAKVNVWERVLNTEFHYYRAKTLSGSTRTLKSIIRAEAYSIPMSLKNHIDGIFNTVQFPSEPVIKLKVTKKTPNAIDKTHVKKQAKKDGSLNTADYVNQSVTTNNYISPAVLNSYYNIFSNIGNTLGSQSVFESSVQYFSPADLSQFQTQFNLPQQLVSDVVGIDSSDSPCYIDIGNCAEGNLDIQYMMAISQVTPTTYWYQPNTYDTFLSWILTISSLSDPPKVNSISYGSVESSLSNETSSSFNMEALKLGVQGVTVIVSSGDDGVANYFARNNPENCGYNPSFPASSPYVTAVGSTQGAELNQPEISSSYLTEGVVTSGGGFSNLFPTPQYQQQAVNDYFSSLSSQPASGYNQYGRGYPDIAFAGHNYEIVIAGQNFLASGTSASTPVVAALVSLVNANRLANNKPTLGFLNPAIYSNFAAFVKDISTGDNKCTASSTCCSEGFTVRQGGWDPVIGFGSIDYQKFYQVFYNL